MFICFRVVITVYCPLSVGWDIFNKQRVCRALKISCIQTIHETVSDIKHNIRYLYNICFIIVIKELELQSIYGITCESRDLSVGIVTRLRAGRPKNRGSIPHRDRRFISSPKRADRLWDPSSVPLSWNRGLFPLGT
jgi:hypothetical protein